MCIIYKTREQLTGAQTQTTARQKLGWNFPQLMRSSLEMVQRICKYCGPDIELFAAIGCSLLGGLGGAYPIIQ